MTSLQVENLVVHHRTPRGTVYAVDGVSFAVQVGETLGVVGESGCGKSTLARAIAGLDHITGGTLSIAGVGPGTDSKSRLARARKVQMIFQDPYGSLNPRLTVRQLVQEPLDVHRVGDLASRTRRARELLERVGLPVALQERLPHQLSGGQRQRVSIARALSLEPQLLICDEPVSALDVSVQAQVLNLLVSLQAELGLSVVFISHDLSVIRYVSSRVAVMYLGKIVEVGSIEDVWKQRLHPYTRALIASAPVDDDDYPVAIPPLRGDLPSPLAPPSGCRFRTRCPYAVEKCATEEPQLRSLGTIDHMVSCHYAEEFSQSISEL